MLGTLFTENRNGASLRYEQLSSSGLDQLFTIHKFPTWEKLYCFEMIHPALTPGVFLTDEQDIEL
jgi:hypothetical protein